MRVLLGLGTSHPQGELLLRQATAALAELSQIQLIGLSSATKSPAWGNGTLFPFTNAAAAVITRCPLQVLWQSLRALEQRFGRLRVWPNGPRTLDVDVLWCDTPTSMIPELTIPHPRLLQRPWALLPAMVAARQASWVLPWDGFAQLGQWQEQASSRLFWISAPAREGGAPPITEKAFHCPTIHQVL